MPERNAFLLCVCCDPHICLIEYNLSVNNAAFLPKTSDFGKLTLDLIIFYTYFFNIYLKFDHFHKKTQIVEFVLNVVLVTAEKLLKQHLPDPKTAVKPRLLNISSLN